MKAFKKGDRVRIRKGTPCHRIRRGNYTAGTTHTVTVHHVVPACQVTLWDLFEDRYCEHLHSRFTPDELFELEFELLEAKEANSGTAYRSVEVSPPKVCWAGAGGYWAEASVHDVEPV